MRKKLFGLMALIIFSAQIKAQEAPEAPRVTKKERKIASAPVYAGTKNSESSSETYTSVSRIKTSNGDKVETVSTYSSSQDMQDEPQKTKTFSKSFSIDKNDDIELKNVYGGMVIKIWNKNEIKVDADIKAYADSEGEAQTLIDNVNIEASKNGNQVSFKTVINDRNNNMGRGRSNGRSWRREVKVMMTVYMPASNALTLSQQYGNVEMPDYNGATSIKVQYGNLVTGNLNSNNNYISIQYGKADLQNVNTGKFKFQYGGGVKIGNVDELELEAQYTSVDVKSVKKTANVKAQYGRGVTIGSIGGLSLTAQYTTVNVGKLNGIFTGKLQYGKLNIDEIEGASKTINVDAQYTTVNLGFAANFNGDFNVNTAYSGFSYGSNVSARKLNDDRNYSSRSDYEGKVNKGGASNISVKSQYGSVRFN
ncbi:hypothetical protein [Pedobacter montanisoli]|uniref:Adhesin domain-containing protein n=1 Tax=Pedobacter montanisoli TaxID=2923277 RepID=A0ABS9ZSY2_9SPHI|nr:hypothetical protein [Pedobacter montanisoli]MCJ0741692.1 hypothetical protein [Pedobacter montanisoli]